MTSVQFYAIIILTTCLRRLWLEHWGCVDMLPFSAITGSTDCVRVTELVLSVPSLAETVGTAKAQADFSHQK